MAFSKKSIRVVLTKKEGVFSSGKNTIDFNGMPVDVQLDYAGLFTVAKVRIYGVSKQHLDEITSLQNISPEFFIKELYLSVFVDEGIGEQELFVGTVKSSIPNYSNTSTYN